MALKAQTAVPPLRRLPARRANLYPWLTVLPVLLLVAFFTLYPFGYAAYLSTHKFLLTQPGNNPFIGTRNFEQVVGDELFSVATLNVLKFILLTVLPVTLLGLAVALLVNEKLRGFGILRALILLPWAIPLVATGIIWKLLLHGNIGALSGALMRMGLIESYVPWLSKTDLAMYSVSMAHIWREFPLPAILFLAGLQTIPAELHDAAAVDGANAWTRFVHITLPLLRGPLFVILIFETIVSFSTFDLVYVLTGGGPGSATTLLSWYAYTATFKFLNLGQGAALSFLMAAGIILFILIYMRILPQEEASA